MCLGRTVPGEPGWTLGRDVASLIPVHIILSRLVFKDVNVLSLSEMRRQINSEPWIDRMHRQTAGTVMVTTLCPHPMGTPVLETATARDSGPE